MGGKSGGKQTTTTEPPKYVQPYLQQGVQDARGLYNQGAPQYYPGNTVVPFSPQTEQAMGMTEQRAINGSPVTRAAQNYTAQTLGSPVSSQFGSARNPYTQQYNAGPNIFGSVNNPYLDATFNKAADSVQQRLHSGFAGSGRNLEAGRPVAAQEMGDLANTIYGGAYENERNRMLSYQQQLAGLNAQGFESAQGRGFSGYENERNRMAQDLQSQNQQRVALTGMAPQLAAQDYADINALGGVGQQVEDLTGRLMQDQAARWDYSQNAPGANLDSYLARLSQYPGGTQSTPTYRNPVASGLGGALMASAIPGIGGWGIAGAGLLGGLFS